MLGKLAIVLIFCGGLFLTGNLAEPAFAAQAEPKVALKYRLIERTVTGSLVRVRLEVSVSNGSEQPLEAVEARFVGTEPAGLAGSRFQVDEVSAESELAFDGELEYSFDSGRKEPPQLAWELSFETAGRARETLYVRW